jgi:hypothetical protein
MDILIKNFESLVRHSVDKQKILDLEYTFSDEFNVIYFELEDILEEK